MELLCGKSARQGSVLIEGIMALTLLLLAVCLNLELLRRAQYEVLLHHGAFFLARGKALGVSGRESRHELKLFLERALGRSLGNRLHHFTAVDGQVNSSGSTVTLRYRFPTFLRFEFPNREGQNKHHFELTKVCRF